MKYAIYKNNTELISQYETHEQAESDIHLFLLDCNPGDTYKIVEIGGDEYSYQDEYKQLFV